MKMNLDNEGEAAVNAVGEYLMANGYTVLERYWRCGADGVDIVAQYSDTLVFVSVEAFQYDCGGIKEPTSSYGRRESCRKAARAYMFSHDRMCGLRFDEVEVSLSGDQLRIINHQKGVFDLN